MPVMDEFKEERASLKNAPLKVKLIYFWDYYKWPVIIAAIVLIVAIYQINFWINRKTPVFHAALINTAEIEVNFADDAHMSEFMDYIGIDRDKEETFFDTSISIGKDQNSDYENAQKLVVWLAAAELDVMAGDINVLLRYGYQGDYMDLRNVLRESELQKLIDSGSVYYIDGAVVEELAKDTNLDIVKNEPTYPDPFDPDAMKDPIPSGVVIAPSSRLMKEYYMAGETDVCSIVINTKHLDTAVKFLDFMCSAQEEADAAAATP
ncbi:MAG: hypothetical protein MJ114_04510 [Acetatifactor sp.]|nr:hypothetical protein [Acetatifactor sp.]